MVESNDETLQQLSALEVTLSSDACLLDWLVWLDWLDWIDWVLHRTSMPAVVCRKPGCGCVSRSKSRRGADLLQPVGRVASGGRQSRRLAETETCLKIYRTMDSRDIDLEQILSHS